MLRKIRGEMYVYFDLLVAFFEYNNKNKEGISEYIHVSFVIFYLKYKKYFSKI